MPVDRLLPSEEAIELIALTRDIADKVLDPIVDEHEKSETYPDGVFAQLGAAGLLSLPQPEEWGGGGQPYEVYLQVLEEIAARWAAVAVAVSVHSLSSHPLLTFGSDGAEATLVARNAVRRADRRLQPVRAAGRVGRRGAALLGCARRTAATRSTARRRGSPTAAGRTSTRCSPAPARVRAASRASWCPATYPGCPSASPRRRWACTPYRPRRRSTTRRRIDGDRLIGAEGQGLPIAFSALDSGRLGIAAVAVGIAQAALDEATRYANERTTFGRKIIDHQGLGFLLADMAAATASARATYLDAARRKDLGRPYSQQASVAKLVATDAAMKVTTDAVQVFGGAGYTRDFRANGSCVRPKITQIFEGTNQIQRLVIARSLTSH